MRDCAECTPGPWRLDGDGMIREPGGAVVAQVSRCGSADESVSNGFMLEASLELYEALERLVAAVMDQDVVHGMEDEVDGALATLAEARGES